MILLDVYTCSAAVVSLLEQSESWACVEQSFSGVCIEAQTTGQRRRRHRMRAFIQSLEDAERCRSVQNLTSVRTDIFIPPQSWASPEGQWFYGENILLWLVLRVTNEDVEIKAKLSFHCVRIFKTFKVILTSFVIILCSFIRSFPIFI